MTQYYLWHFPDAKKCVVKSIGLHRVHIVVYQKEKESEDEFKIRALAEFDELYDRWFSQVSKDFQKSEILSTKTLQ